MAVVAARLVLGEAVVLAGIRLLPLMVDRLRDMGQVAVAGDRIRLPRKARMAVPVLADIF